MKEISATLETERKVSRVGGERNVLKGRDMKTKHGLMLSLVALIVLMLFPSLVTRVHCSGFVTPITIIISSEAQGDIYARYHALTFDNPIPRTFWTGEWYEENPDAIIGVSSGSFHYEETVDLPAGQHVLEYVVSVPPSYAYWSTTIRINGVVVAEGNVTLDDHILISFDAVHPEHELAVALDAPSLLEPGYSSLLVATVTNRGLSNETDVELFLLVDGAVVDSATIPELLTGSSYTLNCLWTPTVEGSYNVTAYASPVPGENFTTNNIATKVVDVFKPTAVYVDPETTAVWLGDTFVINVKIANVTDLVGYEFKLFWNTALLDCVNSTINRIWYPLDYIWKNNITENYDATHGRYWGAYVAHQGSFSGDTTLVSLTFKATEGSAGGSNCTLDLCDVSLVNSDIEPIQDWYYKDSPDDGYVTVYGSTTTCIIRADGSVFPPTAPIWNVDNVTYTLTGNIDKSIVVERDNIVVDGAGYTVQGTGSGNGIKLSGRSNVTIQNMSIKVFGYCIYLDSSSNNIISGNNIAGNDFGIWLESSSGNSISLNNITNCNFFGITLSESSDNTLSGNYVANNGIGIWLWDSFNSSLSGNVMEDNYLCNFGGVSGNESRHFMHSIDVSNLVGGKPIYYLVNQTDLVISSATHPQVGYLALINCVNVTVESLTLTGNGETLLIAYTNDSRVINNNITNNNIGVVLFTSFNNTLRGNTLTTSYAAGFHLELSSNNTISQNTIKNNYLGIYLYKSSNNSIHRNNFVNNTIQVISEYSLNVWDDGYPSGGNYWSDHNPPDLYRGPYQNEAGSDGIGDAPYVIDGNNEDGYPLIYPYGYVPGPDVNGDGIVDIFDLRKCAKAYGTKPGDINWNPNADLNQDGLTDIFDIRRMAKHYLETV